MGTTTTMPTTPTKPTIFFFDKNQIQINLQEMGMGEVPIGNLDTTTALIYDSVTAFAIALNKLDTVQQVNDMFKLKLIVIINQIEQFFFM